MKNVSADHSAHVPTTNFTQYTPNLNAEDIVGLNAGMNGNVKASETKPLNNDSKNINEEIEYKNDNNNSDLGRTVTCTHIKTLIVNQILQ